MLKSLILTCSIVSVAKYILVVEKESVFQRLANDQFCNTNHCIVITGRGYPDISTRRFLGLLVDTLHLPTYCLVDCDPYGFDILSTYWFGSVIGTTIDAGRGVKFELEALSVHELNFLSAVYIPSKIQGGVYI
ncbi:hypothetical protein Pyn_34058 [Prunus yedoensis var. nudiflora]|uniref:Topoisomerase 6 subunit A/Spo11 TOPRIM domain-containing protein n=1 Tax=Prunus yedoensis var. nudiflora TaxID=2094558 RepID=A0A314Y8Y8_PRUYE|nr:hypothetical protein Pyn_34058 [Prunus yedoensis var. nudiflora]